MIPGNVVFVEFSFPPNRRFYKEIISYQAKLFCVIVNATGELKQPRGDGDGDGDRNEKIEKQQI